MSIFSDDSTRTVGARMADARMIAPGSAKAAMLTNRLANAVRELTTQEVARVARAKQVVLPFYLPPAAASELADQYREFAVKQVPISAPVHKDLEAHRTLALAYAMDYCSKYSGNQVVLGNATLQVALWKARGIHVEMDGNNAVAVHAHHTAAQSYHKLARGADKLRSSHGVDIERSEYQAFLTGHAHQICDVVDCKQKSGTYIADGSMYPLSLKQYCAGMIQTGADVGMMLVPYHPDMFKRTAGEIALVGVGFERGAKDLILKYPEGVSGTTRWESSAWLEWLRSSVKTVNHRGKDVHFMIELRQYRGFFLFASVVRLADGQGLPTVRLTHALEMPWQQPMYVCVHQKLIGLNADPMKASSWEDAVDFFPRRIVDNVYMHAMALPQTQFSWEAILKRAYVADSRVTYSGSGVVVGMPLTSAEADTLTLRIYARAFVDRYEMGNLGKEMMDQLKTVSAFAGASSMERLRIILGAATRLMWQNTGEVIVHTMRSMLVAIKEMLSGRPKLVPTKFTPATSFVTYESYVGRLTGHWGGLWQSYGGNITIPNVRGDLISWQSSGGLEPAPYAPRFTHPRVTVVHRTGKISDEIVDMGEPGSITEVAEDVVSEMGRLNMMGRGPSDRFELRVAVATPEVPQVLGPVDFINDPSFVDTINEIHESMFPGMAHQDFEEDARSLMIGGQDRSMESDRMKFPLISAVEVADPVVYKSVLKTYPVERRAQSTPEMLSALTARTLTVPVISTAQDDKVLIPKIWDNFIDMACVPDARERIAAFRNDTVGFEEELLKEWTKKARPATLDKMKKDLLTNAKSLEEYDISEYLVMLKSDAKPPMSGKPMYEQPAPQVIVYHDKILSAIYSSIFRVLVRRFLSLLKPEWMANLLKDNAGVRDHIAANHPWGRDGLSFLENDFSKYDKSQLEFVFALEAYVFEQLGMDHDLLKRWTDGHETCSLRAVALGISLTVNWQRKSGDATTAFGNVIVNMLSVCYAYAGSSVLWAVFMGDDSIVCCSTVAATPTSVRVLGEIFNLQAKFYVGVHPYFASSFILIYEEDKQVVLVPDPIKRIQKWAVSVSAISPEWEDRFRSQAETCEVYQRSSAVRDLPAAIRDRYPVPPEVEIEPLLSAVATAVDSFDNFRSMYAEEPVTVYRRH